MGDQVISPGIQTIRIAGRTLAYVEYGAPTGTPVIYCHGFPGSHLDVPLCGMDVAAIAQGLRLIAIDRPGHSLSDPHPGRKLLNWPVDAAFLADALGLETFSVLGASGGGPYALTLAHQFPARIRSVAVVSGMVPFQFPGAPKDMSMNVPRQPRPVRLLAAKGLQLLAAVHPVWLTLQFLSAIPNEDGALFKEPQATKGLLDGFRETFRRGVQGYLDDARIYREPWGFDLKEMPPGIQFWHGETDVNIRIEHARRLAGMIPGSIFHSIPNQAHFSLAASHAVPILESLVSNK